MLLQLTLLFEHCSRTMWTDQALGVCGQMSIQLTDLCESRGTLIADILLHLVMTLHVVIQVGYLGKRPPTVILNADERTFARMQAAVVVQIRNLGKCFAAVFAHIRSLIAVDPFVVPQVGCLGETLLAIFARELLLFRVMIADVIDQGGFPGQLFLANWTRNR